MKVHLVSIFAGAYWIEATFVGPVGDGSKWVRVRLENDSRLPVSPRKHKAGTIVSVERGSIEKY